MGKDAKWDTKFVPATMQGKKWIVGGIFTTCGSFCPTTVGNAITLQEMIIKAGLKDKVGILLVDMDPVGDTPDKLRDYGGLKEHLNKGVLHVVTAVGNPDKKTGKSKHSPTGMAVIQALNPSLGMSATQGLLSGSDVSGLPVVDYSSHDGL